LYHGFLEQTFTTPHSYLKSFLTSCRLRYHRHNIGGISSIDIGKIAKTNFPSAAPVPAGLAIRGMRTAIENTKMYRVHIAIVSFLPN
jgi:hypothetical protein